MRIALDTNILAYAAGVDRSPDDDVKIVAAKQLILDLSARATLIAPVQALGELFVVLQRAGHAREDARKIVLEFKEAFGAAASGEETLLSALDLSVDHKMQLWDALIVSAAVQAGCTLLVSEDLQDGLVARGLTVVNPFAPAPNRKLAAALASKA